MALLLFAGFFRSNELAALAIQDISISETHLTGKVTKRPINIEKVMK